MLMIDRHIESYHETDTYLAWLKRLILYCFWMAYNEDRWPTDLVSHWASWGHLSHISGVNLMFINRKWRTSDEPRYCNNNAATPRATSFTYQPRVCTNLEVTVLYTQVEVKVLPVVTVYLTRDPRGSKPNFYKVRRSLSLWWKKSKPILRESDSTAAMKKSTCNDKPHHNLTNQLNNYAKQNS